MQTTTTRIDYTKKHWYIFELEDLIELRYGYGMIKDQKTLVPSFGIAGFGNEHSLTQEILTNNPNATNKMKIPGYTSALNALNAIRMKALQKARLICAAFNENHIKP